MCSTTTDVGWIDSTSEGLCGGSVEYATGRTDTSPPVGKMFVRGDGIGDNGLSGLTMIGGTSWSESVGGAQFCTVAFKGPIMGKSGMGSSLIVGDVRGDNVVECGGSTCSGLCKEA